eukprot:SAG22_NODE_104_length_20159_cov_5.877517_3_plen_105_part_00
MSAPAARPLARYGNEPVLLAIAGADVETEIMRTIISNCTPHDLWGALFSDTSDFQERICKERGDRGFSCGARAPASPRPAPPRHCPAARLPFPVQAAAVRPSRA